MPYLESLSTNHLCQLFFKSLKNVSLNKKTIEEIANLWEYPNSVYFIKEFEIKLKKNGSFQ